MYHEHLVMEDVEDRVLSFYGEKSVKKDPYIRCKACETVSSLCSSIVLNVDGRCRRRLM